MRITLFILSLFVFFAPPAKAAEDSVTSEEKRIYIPKEVRQIADHAMKFSDGHDIKEYLFYFDEKAVVKTLVVYPEGSDKEDYLVERTVKDNMDELKKDSQIKWKAGFRTKYDEPDVKKVGDQYHIIYNAYYTMDNSTSPTIYVVEKGEDRSWRIVEHYIIQKMPK